LQIQVLSTSVETKPTTKGSYQQLEVAYKNLTFNGKVESKKLMSFGANAEAFKALVTAPVTSVWDVEVLKNDKGYNDWIKVTKGSPTATTAETPSTKVTAAPATQKGGWETPEERAKKQIYIVRQSSVSAAVNALSVGSKTQPKVEEVIAYARELEKFVFESDNVQAVAGQDVQKLDGFEDTLDVPF
jgi:hypothetical protein